MHKIISYLGHKKGTLLIGFISVYASVFITCLSIFLFDIPFVWSSFILAIILPMLIAPTIAWYFLEAYFKLERLESEMRMINTYDSLTGLLSRKVFFERGEALFQRAKKEGKSISVLYMDLDNFKQINDKYGHAGGDRILSFFSKYLIEIFREDDIVGRVGGEEIVAIIVDVDICNIRSIIKRIYDYISTVNVIFEGNIIFFSVSMGVCIQPESDILVLEQAINQADKALYIAKTSGKSCAYAYSENEKYKQISF